MTFWNEFNCEEDMPERIYENSRDKRSGAKDGSTMVAKVTVAAGQVEKVRFVLSWNVPNNYNHWVPGREKPTWKNYYTVLFEDSKASAAYALKNWDDLYRRTLRFKEALFATTVDPVILDAGDPSGTFFHDVVCIFVPVTAFFLQCMK